MTQRLSWLAEELAFLEGEHLLRSRRCVTPQADGWCEVDGTRLRNFAGNDYLNLAHDLRLVEAARTAGSLAGTGSGASALVTGRTDEHVRLEQRIARFERQAAAILFPTGYAANVGTVCALAGEGDVILSDRLNHASLVDACRLSRARVVVYEHVDVDDLAGHLRRSIGSRRRLIVSDSLFSMDGDAAPLPQLCDLAAEHAAMLLIDEAHATGVLGHDGRGLAEHWGMEDRVDVRVGTLSKALGALGGFVAGSTDLIDWLWNKARTQIFSTALPPATCAAARAALDIVECEPWRREHVRELAKRLRARLESSRLPLVPGGVGPILPVVLQDPLRAVSAAAELEQLGFLVAAIRPPSVPPNTSRLRITVTAAHSAEDVDRLATALASVLSGDAAARAEAVSLR
jgi:8-amino-7-oxononanoate synthase